MSDEVAATEVVTTETPGAEASAGRARDERGRFVEAGASEQEAPERDKNRELERIATTEELRAKLIEREAIAEGIVPPRDSMPVDEWVRARNAQVRAGIKNAGTGSSEDAAVLAGSEAGEGDAEEQGAKDDKGDQAQGSEREQKIVSGWHERKSSFEAEHADFAEALKSIQIDAEVAGPLQLAIMEDPNGPAVVYHLAQHPELQDKLGEMTAIGAVKYVERLSRELGERENYYSDLTRQHLATDIPESVQKEYFSRAAQLNRESPLTQEEQDLARALTVAPHVTQTIISLNAPEIVPYLVKNPHLVGRLNALPPMAAAAELGSLQRELAANAPPKSQAPSPIRPVRRPSSTATGLSDDLSPEEWRKRRQAQVNARRGEE